MAGRSATISASDVLGHVQYQAARGPRSSSMLSTRRAMGGAINHPSGGMITGPATSTACPLAIGMRRPSSISSPDLAAIRIDTTSACFILPPKEAGGGPGYWAKKEETRPTEQSLMEEVVESKNMREAYHKVVGNQGAAGIDEMHSLRAVGDHLANDGHRALHVRWYVLHNGWRGGEDKLVVLAAG